MTRQNAPAISKRVRALLIFALVNLIGVNLVLILALDAKVGGTSWAHTLAFLHVEQPILDSWGPMMAAYLFLKSGVSGSVYQEVFFNQQIKFQYPLSSLLVFPVLERFSGNPHEWVVYLKRLSWVLLALNVFVIVQVFRVSKQAVSLAGTTWERWLQMGLVLALAMTYYPMLKAFSVGQIQAWINSLFALAFLLFLKGKPGAAGALCGILCLIKPQYVLFMLWGLLRKQVAFSTACGAVLASGIGLTLAVFGPQHTLDYLRVTSLLSRHGESYYPNHSVNGLLNRFFFNGNNTEWLAHSFPPFHPGIYGATLATSAIMVLLAFAWKNRASARHQALDFCMLALVCTMASPIAWEHHYGILLPIYAFLLPLCLAPGVVKRWIVATLGISYVLTAHLILAANRLADSWLNVLQSYIFIGACLLLIGLWRLRQDPDSGTGDPDPSGASSPTMAFPR